ncbi:MAG: alpha/beta fold hydrolase BchO [Burkholderiaceae bacterium]
MNWEQEGRDWPNRESSRFVDAAGLRWHVQRMGQGPTLLLLHGTGAATHSWRDLMPLLAAHFEVVAPDLPGHGFTSPAPVAMRSLPAAAEAVTGLLRALGLSPVAIVGHSAGAAISAQMALERSHAGTALDALRQLVWLGAALVPFDGWAGRLAAPAARLLARSPLPGWVAGRAREGAAVQRLIDATGSRLDAGGVAAYRTLLASATHVEGVLNLMGGWDLAPLARRLPTLALPVLWLHGEQDRTVPVHQADAVAARLPRLRLERLAGLGHLAHEEQPQRVAQRILAVCLQPVA